MSNPVKLSYSGIRTYKSCPEKYFNSRKWKTKKTTSAFPFGLAIEEAVTALIKGVDVEKSFEIFLEHWNPSLHNKDMDYYNSDLDLNLFNSDDEKELQGWAVEIFGKKAHWKEELDNAIKSSSDKARMQAGSLEYFNRACWLACVVRAELMIKSFYENILPEIEEVVKIDKKEAFQYKITMANDDGDVIEGYPDYIVKLKGIKEPVILDLKTASSFKYYDEHALETSDQLKTYAAALWNVIGPVKVGYIVLIKRIGAAKSCSTCGHPRAKGSSAKNCKAEKACKGKYDDVELFSDSQLFIKDLQEAELDDTLDEYMNVAVAIKNEVKFRNPASCMDFNRKCEFYDACWRGKKLEDIKDLELKKK